MKRLFLAALLPAALSSSAQSKSPKYARQLDTVAVWRMVADTGAYAYGTHGPKDSRLPRYRKLLEMRERHSTSEDVRYPWDCMNCHFTDYWKHLRYLTLEKAPKPYSWVVIEGTVLGEDEPEIAVEPAPEPEDSIPDGVLPFPVVADTSTIWISRVTSPNFIAGTTIDTVLTHYAIGEMRLSPELIKWLPARLRREYDRYYKLGKYKK